MKNLDSISAPSIEAEQTVLSAPRSRSLSVDGLAPDARMSRICELLAKAVICDWANQVIAEPTNRLETEPNVMDPTEASDRSRILDYLRLVGEASPSAMRETLGLSRMRVYRAIQPLLACHRVVVRGQTRAIRYVLSPGEAAKASLN